MNTFETYKEFMTSIKPEFMQGYPGVIEMVWPFLLAFIATEIFLYKRLLKKPFPKNELGASLAIGFVYPWGKLLEAIIYSGVYLFAWEHRFFTIELNSIVAWFALFIGVEFFYYWYHRFSHRNRWYWASHAVHHTPENIYFAVAFQISITSILTPFVPFLLPLVLMGFHPGAVLFSIYANLIFQFFLHTEIVKKLPKAFEYILNTPSHHRVHHGRNPEYLDKNFGGLLIIFDRLFGTFYEEDPKIQISYGLVNPHHSLSPLHIVFTPLTKMLKDAYSIPGIIPKLKFLASPPERLRDEFIYNANIDTIVVTSQSDNITFVNTKDHRIKN